MNSIQILATEFPVADALADLLGRSRIATRVAAGLEDLDQSETLVVSNTCADQLGGKAAVTGLARKSGSRRLVIVEVGPFPLSFTEELGGRMLHAKLPETDGDLRTDGALLQLVCRIAAPLTPMAAGDAATGALIDLASHVARFNVSVFVNGPTGSGKEVLARLIHARSTRADNPFIAINCAAIPDNMLEALLFGHEKGAFTGAGTANQGMIRAAHGGTLMLDEISEMPLGLQAKLLRVIQERKVTPLGSSTEVPVDIRIIATSNRDMEEEIQKGTFREDLFYRLNVFPIETLALIERPDDIAVLATAMLRRHSPAGMDAPVLTPDALHALLEHNWPGNVRELENVMQRALVLHEKGRICAKDIMINARAALSRLALAA